MRKLKNEDLQRITTEEFKKIEKTPITIVIDNVRSGLNVGSIFRTADAFLIERIILCGITTTPPHKEIRKVALGSTSSVCWEYEKETIDAINKLKKLNYHIAGVEQADNSTKLNNYHKFKKPIAIIFGNEINGVAQNVIDNCDSVIEIPQFGTKHSLNISIACGIVVWDLWKKINS
jgi:tRNA G18 (ribose-2'-O)-methylase SpoU